MVVSITLLRCSWQVPMPSLSSVRNTGRICRDTRISRCCCCCCCCHARRVQNARTFFASVNCNGLNWIFETRAIEACLSAAGLYYWVFCVCQHTHVCCCCWCSGFLGRFAIAPCAQLIGEGLFAGVIDPSQLCADSLIYTMWSFRFFFSFSLF